MKNKVGRPQKNNVAYHRNIPPEIKEKLDKCLTTLKIEYYCKENALCICGANERVTDDCTFKECKHPKYYKK
jgi:hypothetical protein